MIKQDYNSFYIKDERDKLVARMEFSETDNNIIIASTFVDDSLRGQGVGRQLLDEVVKLAHATNKKILPLCPYAQSVFLKDSSLSEIWLH